MDTNETSKPDDDQLTTIENLQAEVERLRLTLREVYELAELDVSLGMIQTHCKAALER